LAADTLYRYQEGIAVWMRESRHSRGRFADRCAVL